MTLTLMKQYNVRVRTKLVQKMCIFCSCEKCLIIQGQPTPLASRCAGSSGGPAPLSPSPVTERSPKPTNCSNDILLQTLVNSQRLE